MAKEIDSVRLVARLVITFIFFGALFFATAGTLRWWAAWLYLFMAISFTIPGVMWMKKNDPQLLKDRMGLEKKKPKPFWSALWPRF